MIKGSVVSVHGDVVQVEFEDGLPEINDALSVKNANGGELVLEVREHVDRKTVNAVSLGFTRGLERGLPVYSKGGPLRIPVGDMLRGRTLNIFGEPIDGGSPVEASSFQNIHRTPPPLKDLVPVSGILGPAPRKQCHL